MLPCSTAGVCAQSYLRRDCKSIHYRGKRKRERETAGVCSWGKAPSLQRSPLKLMSRGKLPEAAEMAREMDCTALLVHKWAQVCFNKAIATAH